MKINTLLVIPILLVMVIMVCVVNKRYQDKAVNYVRKSSVTQNTSTKYLNTSADVHSHFPKQVTSENATHKIITKQNKESQNCYYSGNNFNPILHSLNNKLMMDKKTKYSNLIEEIPVKAEQQRNCSSLSYISPAGPVTALASFPGSGNTWMRHLLQQSTGKYLTARKELNIYVDCRLIT